MSGGLGPMPIPALVDTPYRTVTAHVTLVGCVCLSLLLAACGGSAAGSSSPSWRPADFPAPNAQGATLPSGPHEASLTVTRGKDEIVAQGKGYLEIGNGECALDWNVKEVVAGGHGLEYRIVKRPSGPAFIKAERDHWMDTRDPAAWSPPLLTAVNPVGVALSGETRFQSLCFLTALPALTHPSGISGTLFTWDRTGIDQFTRASNESFLHTVLAHSGASEGEYKQVGHAVTELADLPQSRFADSASPVSLTRDEDAVSLSYSLGLEEPLQVHVELTALPQRYGVKVPERARSWEEAVMIAGKASGIDGLLEQYFSVR